jgi:hypothetical protein
MNVWYHATVTYSDGSVDVFRYYDGLAYAVLLDDLMALHPEAAVETYCTYERASTYRLT